MIVGRTAPHPLLAGVVRHYQSREAELGAVTRRIPLPARTDVLLEFYFTTPHRLEMPLTASLDRAPWVAAVGPQTFRRVDLLLTGRLDSFTVHFAPTGLHALLGVPMDGLTDAGIDASALFCTQAIADLHDELAGASGLEARARIADRFLLARWMRRAPSAGTRLVAAALAHMRRWPGVDRTETLAARSGLSDRQFRRLFGEQVGIAPKRYARILRFEAAVAARAAAPDRPWTDIAHDLGWFDQAHMDKDFRALAGAPPSLHRVPGAVP
ncbi:helix-turn-helix domain-containing protein [uncultured Sphingomonas sp.]|uniref:AraC family transcriptional regulator n=1 Tax=uncultured Sphingomonas sp. TaxID=158754 RepID=UPI0035CA25FD